MSQLPPLDLSIPVLTEVVRKGTTVPQHELDALLAELQTTLAARTFRLTDDLLRSAFAQMEATLFEQITSKLRRQLPDLIDATLREHLEPGTGAEGRS